MNHSEELPCCGGAAFDIDEESFVPVAKSEGSQPTATAVCMTYGRPALLAEAVFCFVQQDYPAKKLLIVNDQPGVEISIDVNVNRVSVEVINCEERFPSLGAKKEFARSLVESDYYLLWDDDDLYLPWRISSSVGFMQANESVDIVNPIRALASTNNENLKVAANNFEPQTCIHRRWYEKHEYPDDSLVPQDMVFMRGAKIFRPDVRPLYWLVSRWGLGVYHHSGIGSNREGNWDKAAGQGSDIPNGPLLIRPGFHDDHWASIDGFLKGFLDEREYNEWREAIGPYLGWLS